MNKSRHIIAVILLVNSMVLHSQEHYSAKRVNFSNDKYDEFSPVILGDKIVFCSNQEDELFLTYTSKDMKGDHISE